MKKSTFSMQTTATDFLKSLGIELLWTVLVIGLVGYLSEHLFKGQAFVFLIPAALFAIGILALLLVWKPKWYTLAATVLLIYLIFPLFQPLFADGFYTWEMGVTISSFIMSTADDPLGDGRFMQFLFWAGSAGLQLLVLKFRDPICKLFGRK
jgi:hypothetical protein